MTNPLAGLGRKSAPDPRDKAYPLKAPVPPRNLTRRTWYSRGVLDQGATSQCVAYSGVKYLTTSPVCNHPHFTPAMLYGECQKVDEWAGTPHDGTSVRALFKVLKTHGYLSEYRWATDVETIVNHILTTGPVEMGTTWYNGMFTPDRHDFLICDGDVAGGHAYLLIGADRNKRSHDGSKGAVQMLNSWGNGWGHNGRAWIGFKDLERLLKDDGEAGVGIELKVD